MMGNRIRNATKSSKPSHATPKMETRMEIGSVIGERISLDIKENRQLVD